MGLAIHKPGQGYWTRMLSAIGGGTLVLAGAVWLFEQLKTIKNEVTRQAVQWSVVVGLIVVFGALGWYLLNKPRIVDFMIATEAEMRKVNWPRRREIIGSTWIVICGTIMLLALLYFVNIFFAWFFKEIGILV